MTLPPASQMLNVLFKTAAPCADVSLDSNCYQSSEPVSTSTNAKRRPAASVPSVRTPSALSSVNAPPEQQEILHENVPLSLLLNPDQPAKLTMNASLEKRVSLPMESASVDVDTIEIRKLGSAKTSMSVSPPHSANPFAGLMPFAKIYLEATTVSALRDSAATRSVVARNAHPVLVSVSHLTSLLIKNAVWPDVQLTRIAQPMLSASKYLEVSVTAPALQDTNQVQMEAVRMLMNVVKVC